MVLYILSFTMALVTLNSGLSSATSCLSWLHTNTRLDGRTCRQRYRCRSGMVEVRNGFCITYDAQDGQYYSGVCPYSYKENVTNRLFSVLSTDPDRLRDSLCGPYNRQGLLCGECIDGYGPAVYSLDMKCVDCSNLSTSVAIVVYLLLQFIPITLVFIGMLVFRLNITSGPLLGYVFFCQFYASSIKPSYPFSEYLTSHSMSSFLTHSGIVLCDFWNLNVFRSIVPPFCVSEKLTNIHVLMLNFIPGLYLFVLLIITCTIVELHARKNYKIINIIVKPVKNKINCVNSVFHVFATSILLLSTENMATLDMATFRIVTIDTATDMVPNRTVLYFDPSIVYHSHEYMTYLIIALLMCVLLVLLPSLLFCVYPTRIYRYLSQFISSRKRLAITAFTEALHSCFKDGLNGTRDYRALAGLFMFIYPLYVIVMYIGGINDQYSTHVSAAYASFVISLLVSYLRPCKSTVANLSLSYHFTMTGFCFLLYHLWRCDLSTPTELLEFLFTIIPLISHILIFIWVGYTLCQTRTNIHTAMPAIAPSDRPASESESLSPPQDLW